MKLMSTLRQPFPYNQNVRTKLTMALFFGLFVCVFLLLFKPFELDQFGVNKLVLVSSVYGLVTFACVLVTSALIPKLFAGTFHEDNWTTGKQILFTSAIVFFVGFVNYLVSPYLVDTDFNFKNLVWFQGITLAIGIIPVSIFFLVRQNQLLKTFRTEAELIESQLLHRNNFIRDEALEIGKKLTEKKAWPEQEVEAAKEALPTEGKIILFGEYQNERVEVYIDDLHLVGSASNYIKLFYTNKEKLIYSIIRQTLKKAEETILKYPNFFKCHRAFIINLDKVIHVEGNAQGYKVRIEGYDELIPVSRNLNKEFSDKLLSHRSIPNYDA